jgi:hypothetical protein
VSGFVSSLVYYLVARSSEPHCSPLTTLKNELIKELQLRDFRPDRNEDRTLSKDFMIYLYKILITYQTIGKEVVKDEYFSKRIEAFKSNDVTQYERLVEERNKIILNINSEIKDIVFDYFNIIIKEYEMSYERVKNDEDY